MPAAISFSYQVISPEYPLPLKEMQTVNTVFPDEETFQKIYGECLEKIPQATEAMKSGYAGMGRMFDKYLAATEEWMFRHAYQCRYEAAMKAWQKGAV